jgi:hypothetical protein
MYIFICRISGVTGGGGAASNDAAAPGIRDEGTENRAVSKYFK